MQAFLRQAKAAAIKMAGNNLSKLSDSEVNHFVMCNESCDLDSAMSALIYAWYMTKRQQSSTTTHYIPILNICRNMYRLRTETNYLLQKFGISSPDLIFRDDLEFHKVIDEHHGVFKLTLVDHHVLSKSEEYLEPYIVEVIDHRHQQRAYAGNVHVEICTVGSCATLIAERIQKAITDDRLEIEQNELEQVTYMIAGPILIDTVNLKESAGKVTPRDLDVISYFWGNRNKNDLSQFYNELNKAKFSAEGLTAEDLMLKDPKFIESTSGNTKVMFSTLHDNSHNFFHRDGTKATVSRVMLSNGCHLWVALAPVEQDENHKAYKPVILHSLNEELRRQVAEALTKTQSPFLDLKFSNSLMLGSDYMSIRMYNFKASRKQLLPIVHHCIK